jgi:hypothetical protein
MSEKSFLNSADNTLEINISPECISYAVSDDNQQVLLRQELNIPIGPATDMGVFEHFFNQPELQILGENVRIHYESNQYQLIPHELFSEKDMTELFSVEHGASENEAVQYQILPKWGAILTYRLPVRMMSFFRQKFPEAEMEHHIAKLLKKQLSNRDAACWLHVRKDVIDLLVVQQKHLQLLNTFEVKTHEDCCYFVLNVYEQLQLDTETYHLNVIMDKSVNEGLINLLKQYIRNVEIIK